MEKVANERMRPKKKYGKKRKKKKTKDGAAHALKMKSERV